MAGNACKMAISLQKSGHYEKVYFFVMIFLEKFLDKYYKK